MESVSIVVVTYNFEKIILECLESLEENLEDIYEIIISDDCSKDKTLDLCYKWRRKIKNKVNVIILESKKNEGVVKNINKGCRIAKGEWIKILAGDDILLKDSIKNIKKFIINNRKAEVIFAKVYPFYDNDKERKFLNPLPEDLKFYDKNIKRQFTELLEGNCIVAPGAIIKHDLLKKMDYFDESFKMVEDYPFWIKLLKNNIKFYFFNEIIVLYRKSNNSVSGKGKEIKVNKHMLEFEKNFYNIIYSKEVKNPIKKWDRYIEIKRKEIIFNSGNKSNIFTQSMRILKVKNLKKYILRILIISLILKLFMEII